VAATNVEAAVSFQNTAKISASSVATATITSFNPGGAKNRLLIVGLTFGQGAPTGVTVKYGATSLALVPSTSATNGNAHTELWYLVNPSNTPANIVATWTGNHDVVMGAVGFAGVDQSQPVQNGTSATGTSTALSLTITSVAGDMTMDTVATLSTSLSAPTQTSRWLDTTPATVRGGGSTGSGAATVTHAWTSATSAAWATSGVSVHAALSGFEVGSFTKTTGAAPASQVIPHGLGQTPKAIILWTESRPDTTFSSANGITFRAASSASTATTTLTITKPAGVALNDVMIAAIGVRPNTATVTAPAGWTLIRKVSQGTATANQLDTYYKVATAAEPASYSWTLGANTGAAGGISAFIGVDPSDPIDVENGAATASSTNVAAPTITTLSTNDMIVTAHTIASAVTFTPPAGMTEAMDVASQAVPNNNGQSLEMNYVTQAAIGATGAKTAVASAQADTGGGETISLKPSYESYFAFGLSDGTTSGSGSSASQNGVATSAVARRMADKALTIVKWDQTLLAEADLSSWNSSSFTLNWTTNDTLAYTVHYLLIAGGDVSAKVVRWQMPTAVGNVSVTGTGFQPTAVIHLHTGSGFVATPPASAVNSGFGLGVMDFGGTQWATEMFAANGTGGADTQRAEATDAAIYTIANDLSVTKKGSFASMDSNGFTVDFTTVANANAGQIYSLALYNVNVKAGNFTKTTGAAPVSQSITGTGFAPSAVFFHSFQDTTQAAPVAQSRMSYGASDVVTEGASAFADTDTANPTNFTAVDKTTKAFVKVDNSTATVDAEADMTSLDPDGFTVNWTTNDAVATEMLYMGFANLVNTQVNLISFNATKYPRGVLLQWKTGAELNNLGFNVYRIVGGVRTKVNASLVAGSGLAAGQGTAVNTELSYALWDLDPAAQGDDVSYMLEDLDLNGHVTPHGPVAAAAGALNAPEPTVAASVNLTDITTRVKDRRVFIFHDIPAGATPRARRQTAAATVDSATRTQWTLAGKAAIKMGVNAPGWYRVSEDELAAAGFTANVDPSLLHLYVDGVEQALRVNARVAGHFTSGDSIEFYATGLDTPYTDTRIYWLASGKQAGLRMASTSNAGVTGTPQTNFLSTVRRKDRSIYFAALENGDKENWFGPLVSTDPASLTLTSDNLDTTATSPAQLTVTLQGVTTSATAGPDHLVTVTVNGAAVGTLSFAGQADAPQTFAVPVSVLVDGDNTVTLTALNGDSDYSLVDELALTYPHTFNADADLLRATVAASGPVTIGGFAGTVVRVVDITDPSASIELTGAVRTGTDGFTSITVRANGAGPRTLLAFSDATVASPLSLQANRPSTWHAASQAHDYVIISHANFLAQAAPLATLRQQQGHTPAVIDVQDVYDEFSFGEKTPQALKDFLQWAKTTWKQAPKFVVLLGDATVDPRDYAGLGAADFVPTKDVPMAAIALETASDDWFVDFNNDGLPEMAIGRLSIRTTDQAAAAVTKIVSYEQAPAQSWAHNVLLAAGATDGTSNFGQFSDTLGTDVGAGYNVNRVYTDTLSANAAHQTLIDRMNDGQLIVNYAGHGSVQLWGTDGTLLTNDDVYGSLTNAARLPFVVAMNCLSGLFNQIWGEESLAEALQRAPNGGAVAVWASSSATPPSTQALVDQELFRLIFQGTYATVGEAVGAAKKVVTNPDLRRSWIFFGDPAMTLNGAPLPTSQVTRWTAPAPVSQSSVSASSSPAVQGPATAHTTTLDATGDLQGALNSAMPGDTIQLQAGAVYTGNFVLPAKSGSDYITIRTATPDARLPGATARIAPAQAPLLAMIQSPNGHAALATAPGAHHYRLLFLEFGANAQGAGDIIQLGDGSANQQSLALVPNTLVIDRCYIHGDAAFGQQRAIALNSASTTIENSYIANIKAPTVSAQAISGWNGPGPFVIINNYLEAAGENFVLGGADASIANLIPSDVTFSLNYLSKVPTWRAEQWRIQTLVTLRNAARVVIDGNVLEHNGTTASNGVAILVMPRSLNNAASASRVEHVQITNNVVRHAPAALHIVDADHLASDLLVQNNLFLDISTVWGGAGNFLAMDGGVDVMVDHNTVLQDGATAVYAQGAATLGLTFTNNILPDNGRGVVGDGTTAGSATIQHDFPGAVWLGNLVAGAPAAAYPTGNAYPASMLNVGFVNLAGGDYRLAANSPYRGTATDGGNPGFDVPTLVADMPPSTLSCPAPQNAASALGNVVPVTFDPAVLTSGAAPSGILCVPASGSLFPLGATTVTCTASDILGRIASCATSVTVQLPATATSSSSPASSSGPTPPVAAAPVANAPAAATSTAAPIAPIVAAPVPTTTSTNPPNNIGASIAPATAPPISSPGSDAPVTAATAGAPIAAPAFSTPAVGDGTAPASAGSSTPDSKKSDARDSKESSDSNDSESKDSTEPNKDKDQKSKVKRVSLKSNVPSTQAAGTTITLTAAPSGGAAPYQYQWRVFDGKAWSLPTEWSATPTFEWTAAAPASDLGMMVGVRSAGSTDETPEATQSIHFVIEAAPAAPDAPETDHAEVKP
jgi:hypothetical protein